MDHQETWPVHGLNVLCESGLRRDLWRIVAESFQVERVGRKRRIANDEFRTPHVDLLYGKDGWVEHVDNKIRYQYDVTKCMFSIGNIGEKLRIAKMGCRGETVVDMFAGIGYFTLPYLVHAGASHVYAIEWNPDALEALSRNVEVNKVAERCTVIEGDCRKVSPSFVADRVNLGLLPTSKHYWLAGAKTLKPSGGVMHIHDTVTSSKIQQRKASLPATALAHMKNDVINKNKLIRKQMSLQEASDLHKNFQTHDSTQIPNDTQMLIDEGTSTVVTNDAHVCGTSEEEGDEKGGTVRKISRSQSILQEIESKPQKEPEIEEEYKNDIWDCLDSEWQEFAMGAARKITGFLNNLHEDLNWQCRILRVGKVKSYAPHIDHVVLDLECRPYDD